MDKRFLSVKKFLVVIYIILLVLLLIFGIYYADLKTRSIGFEDALPVLYFNVDNDSMLIHFMGKSINLNINNNFIVDLINKKTVPYGLKALEALNDVTKKIIDWFAQVCGL